MLIGLDSLLLIRNWLNGGMKMDIWTSTGEF